MNRIWNFAREYGATILWSLMLLVAVVTLGLREYRIYQFKTESREYTFVIDLTDDCTIEEAAAIQKNLEQTTFQPVSNELLDQSRQVYRFRINCPPNEASSIRHWLSGRKWVEDARESGE